MERSAAGGAEYALYELSWTRENICRGRLSLSVPEPAWLGDATGGWLDILEAGMYCVHFCTQLRSADGCAALYLNGREVAGTRVWAATREDPLCGSATVAITQPGQGCRIQLKAVDLSEDQTEYPLETGIMLVFRLPSC